MSDTTVKHIAKLMREQAVAYKRLENATMQLTAALARGALESIETLTRTGESELLKMRSRLLQITSALTTFTEARAKDPERSTISQETRADFEAAAKELIEAARAYERASGRASSVALGGSSFTTACIQICGVPPLTYRAPILKFDGASSTV